MASVGVRRVTLDCLYLTLLGTSGSQHLSTGEPFSGEERRARSLTDAGKDSPPSEDVGSYKDQRMSLFNVVLA